MKIINEDIAAIYIRISTTKESQKDSPEHQKGVCLEKARELGLDVHYFYEDHDTGTSIVGRDAIQQLIRDAKDDKFNVILFASLSRFSRDTYDSLGLKRVLVDTLGIRLISIDENFDSNIDKDEFKFQIISAVNQKLSEQISLSSKRGLRQSALSGNFTGNIAPYGYEKTTIGEKKTLVIEEDTASIVRKIYDLFVNYKYGEKNIVKYLNENNIPSAKGGLWGLSSVKKILRNEVYIGQNVFSKYESKKIYNDINNMSDRKRKVVPRDKEKWERSNFKTHESIIDDETFNKAQEIIDLRSDGKRGGVRHKANIFAGLIFCSKCGSSMVSMKAKDGRYRYLVCSKRRRQGDLGCDNNIWVPYFEIRNEIVKQISYRLSDVITEEKIHTSLKKQCKRIVDKINDPKKEINKLEKKILLYRKSIADLRFDKISGKINQQQFDFELERINFEIKVNEDKISNLRNDESRRQNGINIDVLAKEVYSKDPFIDFDLDNIDETNIFLKGFIEKILIDHDGKICIYDKLE